MSAEATVRRLLCGWGNATPTSSNVLEVFSEADVPGTLDDGPPRGAIARGLGRSYNDAAQNAGGLVIDLTRLRGVRSFDPTAGRVCVTGGVSISDLIDLFLPRGWFPAVTPGTRFVTVGGAIAADVHGKNHHRDGSFTDHVERFTLAAPGTTLDVSRSDRAEVFDATAGGLGLTGVILDACVRLKPVESAWVSVDTERVPDLDDLMHRMTERDNEFTYSVAWIDCLATGRNLGRSVLTRGDFAAVESLPSLIAHRPFDVDAAPELAAPPWAPSGLLNRLTVRAFNEMWFRKAPKLERSRPTTYRSFFYPLDGIEGWNRLYGPRGFVQYQVVVPFREEAAIRAMLEHLSRHRAASFLSVLKRFGPGNSGHLSFPQPGWTLALDIPLPRRDIAPLLDELDRIAVSANGRVYLAKDGRVSRDVVEKMYPRLAEWRRVRDELDPGHVMQSDLARRLGLTGRAR